MTWNYLLLQHMQQLYTTCRYPEKELRPEQRPGKSPVLTTLMLKKKQSINIANFSRQNIPLLVGYLGFFPPPTSAK